MGSGWVGNADVSAPRRAWVERHNIIVFVIAGATGWAARGGREGFDGRGWVGGRGRPRPLRVIVSMPVVKPDAPLRLFEDMLRSALKLPPINSPALPLALLCVPCVCVRVCVCVRARRAGARAHVRAETGACTV